MCGINIFYRSNQKKPKYECLQRMNHALHHRGPDSEGIYINDGIGMGHTRLSIVDLTSGQQPMTTASGELTITYNGELYNFKSLRKFLVEQGFVFRTESDTEVVLSLYQLYGSACVEKMRGMFSFAIHEKSSGKLFIARDRLGIKPLFYHWHGKTLIAASEMKAIFASGHVEPKLCKASIRNYFTYQFSISPNTPFESIYELAAGHHMTIMPNSEPKIEQYWDLEFPKDDEYESLDENHWLQAFESEMEDSVNSHTIGDVPVGSYLSGGIDSCSITELLTKTYSKKLNTYSIGFEDQNYDESRIYRQVAEYLNVGNSELIFSNTNNYLERFQDCLYHLEQPQRMSVDIPHFLLSKMVRDENCKVVCTGDGADEILAGYDCFRQDQIRTRSNGLIKNLFRKRDYLSKYKENFAEDHMRMLLGLHSNHEQKKTMSKFGFYPAWHDFWSITKDHIADIFLNDSESDTAQKGQIDSLIDKIKPNISQIDPLNQSLYFEMKTRLPGWILWKSDRLSMAHGVEARVPFMDHKLVELAAKIPPQYKLNGLNEKYILKRMMQSRLPEMPHQFKKRGFYTPIREWFFTKEKEAEITEYFSFDALRETNIFNPVTVISKLNQLKNLPQPESMNDYYQCMRLEWIVLTVLSVQILHKLFVAKQAPCFEFNLQQDAAGYAAA